MISRPRPGAHCNDCRTHFARSHLRIMKNDQDDADHRDDVREPRSRIAGMGGQESGAEAARKGQEDNPG